MLAILVYDGGFRFGIAREIWARKGNKNLLNEILLSSFKTSQFKQFKSLRSQQIWTKSLAAMKTGASVSGAVHSCSSGGIYSSSSVCVLIKVQIDSQ